MFQLLGNVVTRVWPILLGIWIAALAIVVAVAPSWDKVAESGQFAFLPAESPSNRGEQLFRRAFPDEPLGSSIAIVLSREDGPLQSADRSFIEQELKAGLQQLATSHADADNQPSPIARIRTLNDKGTGALLISGDKKAGLVVVDLTTEFLERRTWPIVAAVEALIARLRQQNQFPEGLESSVTGSATVGRDVRQMELISATAIERWTIAVIVVLLLVIYRAPLLALIPILTVFLSVTISLKLLSMMGQAGWITLAETIRIYITVVAYGAGVDYCLFLTARYREELENGVESREALANAVGKVGGAVTASAATVICGIAMMAFARFGKYHQAGLVIPFSLVIVLLAVLTFSSSLLRLAGRWAFWPARFGERNAPGRWMRTFWEKVGNLLVRRPGAIWLASTIVLMPLAVVAVLHYDWDYSLTGELPAEVPSAAGNRALARHFSPGITGPVSVLLRSTAVDFHSMDANRWMAEFASRLEKRKDELRLEDIRSMAEPFGTTPGGRETLASIKASLEPSVQTAFRQRAGAYYISGAGELRGHLTRLDLVMSADPLSNAGIDNLLQVERALRSELLDGLKESELEFTGATAKMRDLEDVTSGDLRRIEVLVPAVVFVILLLFLRRLSVSIYLILSVLFSYLATLGLTYLVFRWLDPASFIALYWKAPIFLFTVLVAVGEDYNIFLMTRVKEEQSRKGPVQGVAAALVKTGGIISSCGFIMAGTFASLFSGSLIEMKQLGFALAFGILLDTLVVRPILVPAVLILIGRRKENARPSYSDVRATAA